MQGLVPTHIESFEGAIGGGVARGHIVLLRGASGTLRSSSPRQSSMKTLREACEESMFRLNCKYRACPSK